MFEVLTSENYVFKSDNIGNELNVDKLARRCRGYAQMNNF